MKVRTTLTRLRAIELALRLEDRPLYNSFEEVSEVTDQTATRLTIDLPAVAWQRIMGVLEIHAFNERGQQRRGHSHQALALTDIATAYNAFVLHPAFRDWRALGWQHDWIPGFIPWNDRKTVKPWPPGKFVIAEPIFEKVSGEKMTAWKWWPAEDIPRKPERLHRSLKESTHLLFSVQVQVAARPDLDAT
jgi:hypothetical protein